jgi:hypothetical protein
MAIGDDFTINYGAKTVTHTGGTTVYTALAFFQWLANTFAASAQMDDDYAFVSDTPTVFRWVNGWNMGNETSYQFLKGGSIETSDGNDLFANLYSIGDQFRSSQIYVVQNDAEVTTFWGTGNIDILIKVKNGGSLIDGGNVTVFSRDTDCLYDHNVVDLSGGGRNPVGINTFEDLNYRSTGDIYLTVADESAFDIGNYVYGNTSTATGRVQYKETGKLYLVQVQGTFAPTETVYERTSRTGSNGSSTSCTAKTDVIAGYTDIKFAQVTRKFSGGTSSSSFTIGETITQTGTEATFLFAGEVSNEVYVEDVSGNPNGTGLLTGGSSGCTYTPTTMSATTTIAKDMNNGAGAQPYNVIVDGAGRSMAQIYQYLKYVCAHNSTLQVNGDGGEEYLAASGSYTSSKQAPFGSFAGGTFFGARGVWIEDYLTAAFSLTDASNVQQNPPSYQKVNVSHASLSGCQILIAERSGIALIKNQYTIDNVTSSTIVVTSSINANKTPQSGTLRVGDAKYAYTGFSGSTFSGVTPDPTGKTGSLYVPLLDVLADATSEVSDNLIFASAFDVKARVRKYGFKDFTLDTSFGSGGLTVTPILTTDPQAT